MNNEYLVVKSNYFIMNSSYDLSLEEQKIILTLSSMVNPEDDDFKSYKFKIKDFMELLGIKDQTKYIEIPKITKELMKKVFEIEEGNTLIQTAWLSGAKYEKGSGEVTLTFSSYLKPYMLKLNQLYTQYKLSNVLLMKSKYSPKIYEILKSNEFKKQKFIEIEVDKLRKMFKAEDIYPLYADFKRHVIQKTQKELKKYTDIAFDFEEIKTGRKVTSIKFIIKANEPTYNKPVGVLPRFESKNTSETENPLESILEPIRDMVEEPISNLEIKKLYDAANGDITKISLVYRYYQKVTESKKIDNMMGYLLSLLKNGYNQPIESKTKAKKKDFDEREYDYDELERKLLGWDK